MHFFGGFVRKFLGSSSRQAGSAKNIVFPGISSGFVFGASEFCYCFASILHVPLSFFPRKTLRVLGPCFPSLPSFSLPLVLFSRGQPGCSFCLLLVLCRQDLELEGAALRMPCFSLPLLSLLNSLFSLCPGRASSASASLCLSFLFSSLSLSVFLSFFPILRNLRPRRGN